MGTKEDGTVDDAEEQQELMMTTITLEIKDSEYKRLREESDKSLYFFPEYCKRLLRLSQYISKEDMDKYNKQLESDKELWGR